MPPEVLEALKSLAERGFIDADPLADLASSPEDRLADRHQLADFLDEPADIPRAGCIVQVQNLPAINSVYGYSSGDLALEIAAYIVEAILRARAPTAIFGRPVGATLLVVFGPAEPKSQSAVADQIRESLGAAELKVAGHAIHLVAAVERFDIPAGAKPTPDDLLRFIDGPAGQSQDDADPSPDATRSQPDFSRQRAERVSRIIKAFRDDTLELHFQPIIDLETGQISDVEALARLRDSDRVIPAADFIDDLYKMGYIVELDTRVIRRIRAVAKELARIAPRLFINLSPASLGSSAFRKILHDTTEAIRATGVEMVIVFELTEQSVARHVKQVNRLHDQLEIGFAIDDFGTGYSSLRTVNDLASTGALSYLKIDGSLVTRIDSSPEAFKVVLAIGNLGKSLGLSVIAEHVESDALVAKVRMAGLRLAQGNCLCPAVPLDELAKRYGHRATEPAPAFAPDQLHLLEPYLPKAFGAFYDIMLANPHFGRHFSSPDEVPRLLERQQAVFLKSLNQTEAERRETYVRLGHLHAELGISLPTFLGGIEILDRELLDVLANISSGALLIHHAQQFFHGLRQSMALGYLEDAIDRYRENLAAARSSAHVASPLLDCPLAFLEAIAVRTPDSLALASSNCPVYSLIEELPEGSLSSESARRLREVHDELHQSAVELKYFLEHENFVLVLHLVERFRGLILEAASVVRPA